MDDFIKSVKATLYDRMTSPLIGSFILAWGGWNHRLIFMFISGRDVYEKFAYVDVNAFPTSASIWIDGIAIPLGISALMIFVLPYPAKWVYKWSRHKNIELRQIQQDTEDETPVTQEEFRAMRAAARRAEEDHQSSLKAQEAIILRLREDLKNAELHKSDAPMPLPIQSEEGQLSEPKLDEFEAVLLRAIAQNPNGLSSQQIEFIAPNNDLLGLQYAIDRLVAAKLILIEYYDQEEGRPRYKSTALGRANAVARERTMSQVKT